MKKCLVAGLLTFAVTSADAEPKKLNVDFGFFPKGTSCSVSGTTGKVTLKTGREIEFKVRGDTSNVSFHCTQPDGRKFSVATGPLLPQGNHSLVAVQINQDNNAYVMWDQGGLRKLSYPGILNWQ
ncbi:MAG: hypothetical protein ACU0A6_11930 [Shimia sp.]|uniref:hypothetical protein n=1 Tax=Shimia sp. TaxID=1954381 RepID=UPI0040589D1E